MYRMIFSCMGSHWGHHCCIFVALVEVEKMSCVDELEVSCIELIRRNYTKNKQNVMNYLKLNEHNILCVESAHV